MSQESALKFILDSRSDDKLKGIARSANGSADALIAAAAQAGYEFNLADLQAASKQVEEMKMRGEVSLSDDELGGIAGGVTVQGVPNC
jgi:predicted ribosomally synthesized peptide with nif11-like leader